MSLNINQIRNDISNYGEKIFLNSAGSSLSPAVVNKRVKKHLDLEEKVGGYSAAEMMEEEILLFYQEASQLIGCRSENIAFTNNATDSYLRALFSFDYKVDDVIITTDDDYASNHIHFISLRNSYGIKVLRIANLENGDLDIDHFKELISKHHPKLIAITHVPTNSGLVQNVKEIGETAYNSNIPFLLDACQSIGQLTLDVQELKCDFLSATGRKFLRGPRGTGFLYVSDRMLESNTIPLMIDGKGAIWNKVDNYRVIEGAKRYEMWEKSYALQLGLMEAIKYANEIGLDQIEAYSAKLMKQFRENLTGLKGINLYDGGRQKCNILTLQKEGKSMDEIQNVLTQNQIFHSVSEKEWGFIDFSKKGVEWVIRLSPHYFNTFDEIDKASEIIDSI